MQGISETCGYNGDLIAILSANHWFFFGSIFDYSVGSNSRHTA